MTTWVNATTTTSTQYYHFNGQRIAMRQGDVLTYLHGDHLGSASLATTAAGAQVSAQRYLPYGGTRDGAMPTDRQFTGQRHEATLGFYDYNARQYDPVLGRFLQADTIVPAPGNPQSLNRYAYVLNNPLRYTDPSGHFTQDEIEQHLREQGLSDVEINALIYLWTHYESHADWWQLLLTAQVGDKLDGIEAGKSVVGFFRAGANGSFNFSSAFGSELIFSVADYYSNNPLDGNAHIRTDIILARKGDSLGLNTDRYVFHGGTDIFANGIPDLPRPDTRDRDLGFVGMALGFAGMLKGTTLMVAALGGSVPTLGATLPAVAPGAWLFVGGAFSYAKGLVLVVDHYVALSEIKHVQNRLQPYAP